MQELIISNSMAASTTHCPTQAVLRTMGYTGLGALSPKLFAGNCAHLCLEAWLQGKTPDECLSVFERAYRQWSDTYIPDTGRTSQLRWENLNKILTVFLSLNSLNTVDFDVVETERQVAPVIYSEPNLRIKFSDKMDGKVRMHASGGLASFEHKTGEWIDDEWFNRYDGDGQVTGHVFAGSSYGDPVGSVVINAIQFNALPNLDNPANIKKKGGYRSCPTHHIPYDQCLLDHVKWTRREFVRTEAQIEQWKNELTANALSYYRDLVNSHMALDGIHYVSMRGLLNGHCRNCEFRDFCLASQRQNVNYLVKAPPRDSSVLSSGLYEVEE